MFDVVALGELLIDFTATGLSENGQPLFERNPGGAPANVLAVLSKYGASCAFIGKVGRDMFGDFLKEELVRLGVDCGNLVFDPLHNTTLAFVAIDGRGERSFSFYRNFGADTRLVPEEIDPEPLKSCRIFHFGTLSMTHANAASATIKALEIAKKAGALISFDPNYRPLLWPGEQTAIAIMKKVLKYVDIAKFSLEEARMVTGEASPEACVRALLKEGPCFAAVTLGPEGSVYAAGDTYGFCPAYPAEVSDTTGAGDIFWGALLHEFLRNGASPTNLSGTTLQNMVRLATVAAAMSTEKKGAIPSIPDYDRVAAACSQAKWNDAPAD